MSLSVKEAAALVAYNPEDGSFRWLSKPRRAPSVLTIGTVDRGGYLRIGLLGKRHLAHRLAWLLSHGEWPAGQIDHKNGDKLDNRLTNLRLATHAQNLQNRGLMSTNPAGLKGAHRVSATGKWRSTVSAGGTTHYLGTFSTAEEAHAAYMEAAALLHGEFVRPPC